MMILMLILMTTAKVMMSNKHLVAAVDLEAIEGLVLLMMMMMLMLMLMTTMTSLQPLISRL